MMKRQVLFTAATSGELKVIKQKISKQKSRNISFNFLLLGIGNYSTILSLQEELIKQKYDFIVNIGVCGYINKCEKVIQIGRIKNLSNNKELIIPNYLNFSNLRSIACSEKIIYSIYKLGEEEFVDMESYGVELVCSKFEIPRILLKVPVDRIGEETKNFDFEKAKKLLNKNIDYNKLSNSVITYLEKNGIEEEHLFDLTFIQQYYKMTFSEKLIFEKLFNKYQVLVEDEGGECFETFFEESKELDKTEFFRKLDEV